MSYLDSSTVAPHRAAMIPLLAALTLQAAPPPPPPTAETWRDARAALDRKLIDYPSARFRDVGANAAIVCGYVNAKNRLGGFTGWTPFAVLLTGEDPTVWLGEGDAVMREAVCEGERRPAPRDDYAANLTLSAD